MEAEIISYTSKKLKKGKTEHNFHILINDRLFIVEEIRRDNKVKRKVKAQEKEKVTNKDDKPVWTGKYKSNLIQVSFTLKDKVVQTLKELTKESGFKRDKYY